jgi:hypothetical protein
MKKAAFWEILLVLLGTAAVAQTAADRLVPRSDLNAVPGPGQSEVHLISKLTGRGASEWWINVSVDGVLVAQVEPGIPEKLILPNGFSKLRFVVAEYNSRRKAFTNFDNTFGEIVCELDSNSTAIEIEARARFLIGSVTPKFGSVTPEIVSVEPLNQSASAAAHVSESARPRVTPRPAASNGTLVEALYRAGDTLANTLPETSTIAILSVSTQEREMAEFVVDELAYVLVNDGYRIVDRRSLEAIRTEQNFQLSGEVDDESAVSIGKLLGANVVITGSISGTDAMRRLRLKALEVQTAQIVAMASEPF